MCNRSNKQYSSGGGWSYSYSYSTSSNTGSNCVSQSFFEQDGSDGMGGGAIALPENIVQSTGNFEEDALKAHNEYRKRHGVPLLELSQELCSYAAEWAKNLSSRGVMQHRSDNKYGENIFCKYGSGNIDVDGPEAVKSWYDEIQHYNFNAAGFNSSTGHFTQVIWRNSKKLGIAKVRNNKGQIFVVANYDPPGNYQGQFPENVPKPGSVPAITSNQQAPMVASQSAPSAQAKTESLDGFSEFEVECLTAHNAYRAQHQAAPLRLNRNLCNFAAEWANHLASLGVMKHRSNNSYGENIYCKYGTGNIQVNGKEGVDSWYNEIKDYRFGNGGFSMNTGHFTQVVWRGSTELGVGMAKNSRGQIYVVANYNPAGNYQGQFRENVLPRS